MDKESWIKAHEKADTLLGLNRAKASELHKKCSKCEHERVCNPSELVYMKCSVAKQLQEINEDDIRIIRERSEALGIRKERDHISQDEQEHLDWMTIAIKNGISAALFEKRVTSGIPYKTAATMKPPKSDPLSKFIEQAEANGIPEKIFRERIKKNWSTERAATQPIQKNARFIIPPYPQEVCEPRGITESMYYYRMYKGWPYEAAVSLPKNSHLEPRFKPTIVPKEKRDENA